MNFPLEWQNNSYLQATVYFTFYSIKKLTVCTNSHEKPGNDSGDFGVSTVLPTSAPKHLLKKLYVKTH